MSFNRYNFNEDINLNVNEITIGSDLFSNWITKAVIGHKTNIDTNSKNTIGDGIPTSDNSLDITFPTTSTKLSLASTSINDNISGSGARKVIIFGLDSDYKEIQDIVELNGINKVLSNLDFYRVNYLSVELVGSNNYNEGIIYCSEENDTFINGIPQNIVYNTIGVGSNNSMVGIYTIPYNHRAIVGNVNIACDAKINEPINTLLEYRLVDYPFWVIAEAPLINGSSLFDLNGSGYFPPKTDLRFKIETPHINKTMYINLSLRNRIL